METFRRLLPTPAEGLSAEAVAAEIPGPAPAERPFVLLNMIATADGRATVEGRTAPIANRADYELFHALRARTDAVMVGAETIRPLLQRLVPQAEVQTRPRLSQLTYAGPAKLVRLPPRSAIWIVGGDAELGDFLGIEGGEPGGVVKRVG